MDELLIKISEDRNTRAVIITGGENCFCAGADVKESTGIGQLVKEDPIYRITHRYEAIYSKIERLPKPTIAASKL